MYFKKLEIVGFKSFLNKAKFIFEPGVTAIVGPNGCGKSNVVDAVKWVLGEQSAKSLRGLAMQDVIFNGTEKHDPVNIAEVSLTLSNEDRILPVDYDEVIISRRLYRSGESEYLLNKMPVRLVDIRNLLMGTGIGTSSYSIVEQGRMDMILSSKPEERRYVFEEASGITRYKSKKREALLKLERTKDNLTRLNDIIREVERQINSIERKARKAERYKARHEELKGLDVMLSCKKFKELNTDDASLGTAGDEVKQLSETLSLQLEGSTVSLSRLREGSNAVLNELHETQNVVTRLSTDIDKNTHVVDVNTERIGEFQGYVERLEREIEETTERKEAAERRLGSLEDRFQNTRGKRQSKDDELASAEENVKAVAESLQRHKHQLKFSKEKIVDMVSGSTKEKNTLIKTSADMQNAISRKKRLRLEKHNVQTEKDNASEEFRITEEKAGIAGRELEDKKQEFRVFNDEHMVKQQKLSLLNNEKGEKEKRLNEIKPRRQFLEKLISEREGINESVKMIMEHVENDDPRFSGVHGILSELISVAGDYEESMESILGDAVQAIVVETRQEADRIIGYLEENSMGSVNFVILEELRKLSENGSVITKGILDDITHVLIAKGPYCSALHVLLRDTFVTVSPEAARTYIDRNNDFNGRIIGKKGEIYRKGMYRSRNFSTKEVIPLFGRREKVDQMRADEGRITAEIENMNVGIVALEEWLKDSAVKKERLESELRERQMEFADISSKKAAVKEKFDSLVEELFLLDTEIEEEETVVKQLREESERLQRILEELDAENARLQQALEKEQQEIQDCTRYREETFFCVSDIKVELSALRKEEENLDENLERERDSFQRIDRNVQEKRDRIKENNDRIRTLKEEMVVLKESNIEHAASLETRNREISEKEEQKNSLIQEIRQGEEKVKTKERELEALKDKTRDLDIRTREIEYRRTAIVERMLDLYKVDIIENNIEIKENVDWDETSRCIDDLKQQLEKMGEVSLGAVEEHKQLEERYRFLTKQRDDLTGARESLMQAITKLNRTSRKMFLETFESIKKEFNDYFRMLFNGGKAELVLEDESNVLECGIDIIVKPPGKKLHNIMQLSGGEKAMTAIALIFAIFKVNPSPFCILDEIDAPLDESNIVRFCSILQEFLKLSQFVIVTHNRMTIQLADVLYGITMEEKGVSKIVSVKFTEEKEEEEFDTETIPVAA
jgi:chromosome segregation protein